MIKFTQTGIRRNQGDTEYDNGNAEDLSGKTLKGGEIISDLGLQIGVCGLWNYHC